MAVTDNKDVVRRFMTEVLMGGQFERVDELLAPGYVNRAFGGADLTTFKGLLGGLVAVVPVRRFDIEELIGDGNAVVARFTCEMRTADGKTIAMRGLTYYRLIDGRIVEDDPITTPDLAQELAPLMAPAQA